MTSPRRPDRISLAPGLEISRVVTGLWQVADQERGGRDLDRAAAAADMRSYAEAGFDSFDMADHYGTAELIAGRFLKSAPPAARVFTKWCPKPGPMTREVVRRGIEERLDRLESPRIDLLQFHWWSFEHPGYLDAMKELSALREEGVIGQLGVTNFDTDHLRVLVKHGIPVVSNQVCFSLLDRRAAEDMSGFCLAHGIRLLAYGTLGGGFLAERWLGAPEPSSIGDWSKMKYKRFIDAVGGWDAVQQVLATLAEIAARHGVSIANVATRWVLEQPAVGAVIVGARLTEREHRADNLRLFDFALDGRDKAALEAALSATTRIPGDCGDEYRRPPFLTASGDLSHHLEALPKVYAATAIDARPDRLRIDTGSVWEKACGYSRAVRVRDRILVCGTTATHGAGEVVCPGDVAGQTTYILDKIVASVTSLGGRREDIVRTRIYMRDAARWEEAARVHGRYFADVRPANTLIEIADLVGDYEIEIEAEAELG
ncbi:MAG: aldo/keto reductase [Alphaproteobacteria bacterium]|nr:aldo/keto reductase [Alphaproteobacteria bacterium]